ncbi:MAG: saccharopine dehydrogenase NADP-binding domain-containing protein [Bacteroidetes bacterium]|nr:saccharopine dehydrogenase NADP-binding domain-containing protein [Bacteroidota bacterium]
MKIIVLGGGLVGGVIARDLKTDFDVTIADNSKQKLKILKNNFLLKTIFADLSNQSSIKKIVKNFDLVIGAVPGHLGFNLLKSVIEAKKNIVDISFFPEDAFKLDKLAKKNKVIAIVDSGIAPGGNNLIIGYHYSKMERLKNVECYVGGLPLLREPPFEYKIVFSVVDVIEEYTRPSRIIKNGKLIIKDALSDIELHDFQNIGLIESFNTDGLRTLLKTIKAKNIKEKTLRYPGHAQKMKILSDAGLFSKKEVLINGKLIRPLDLTVKLLLPKWKLKSREEDLTIMRVIVDGIETSKLVRYQYDLFDRFDKNKNITSMARTTGYFCSTVARLIAKKLYNKTGISPLEYIGANEKCFNFIFDQLSKKKINFEVKKINLV